MLEYNEFYYNVQFTRINALFYFSHKVWDSAFVYWRSKGNYKRKILLWRNSILITFSYYIFMFISQHGVCFLLEYVVTLWIHVDFIDINDSFICVVKNKLLYERSNKKIEMYVFLKGVHNLILNKKNTHLKLKCSDIFEPALNYTYKTLSKV